MDQNRRLYRLDYTGSFWQKFRYTISSNTPLATPIYRVRRTVFHRYRQFEDAENIIYFKIHKNTIRSTGDNRILATITPDGTMIRTYVGNFTLTDLSILRRSYTLLRSNGDILMRVQRNRNAQRDTHGIEMNTVAEDHEPFLFALTVLIDSILLKTGNRRKHP